MKKLLTTLIFAGFLAFSGSSAPFVADVSVRWVDNPPLQFITKYVVYQQKAPSTNWVPAVTVVGTNAAKIRLTSSGTYRFAVSAFNANGESPFSNVVRIPETNVMATAPLDFKSDTTIP